MSFKDLFKKKNMGSEKEYTEADNVGTRQDTFAKAQSYWLCERPGLSVRPPFALYAMPSAAEAEAALMELPFLHKAKDSGKLIADRIMTFGFYPVAYEGVPAGACEALVCGSDLTLAEFNAARKAFEAHGGKCKSSDAPDASVKAMSNHGDARKVKYKEKTTNGNAVYEVYTAPDKACAVAFLRGKRVAQKMYYICVDTPEGSFGRDINGIYQE